MNTHVRYHLRRGANPEDRRAWRAWHTIEYLLNTVCPPAFRRALARRLVSRYAHSEAEVAHWFAGGADAEEAFFDAIEEAETVDAIGPTCGWCHMPFKRQPTVLLVAPEMIEDKWEWSRLAKADAKRRAAA